MRKLAADVEQEDDGSGESCSSSSSSRDGFYDHTYNQIGSSSSGLSTGLSLALALSSSSSASSSRLCSYRDWPPIKAEMRRIAGKSEGRDENTSADSSLLVKVYMEGILIGRKVDLLTQRGYHTLFPTLSYMFNTTIFGPDVNNKGISEDKYILTYEDGDGDWMLVGDVPWEMFLSAVKKLRITKAETC